MAAINNIIDNYGLTFKSKPFENQTSKSPVFKCFRFSKGRFSDPHCIKISSVIKSKKGEVIHFLKMLLSFTRPGCFFNHLENIFCMGDLSFWGLLFKICLKPVYKML